MSIHKINEEIFKYIEKINTLAKKANYNNISQSGLIKEIIIASILKHNVIQEKHLPDAYDPNNKNNKFEYLTCQSGKSYAIDGMFSRPESAKNKSLKRITRNKCFYCAEFNGWELLSIWEVPTECFYKKCNDDLIRRDGPSAKRKNKKGKNINREHTLNFSRKWVENNGKLIWRKNDKN